MKNPLKRYYGRKELHFITFSCYQRGPLLGSRHARGTPSQVIQVLKQRVSRAMRGRKRRSSRGQYELPFPEEKEVPRRFWQRRFYDFNVWSRGKLKEKLNYMHANPVTRKGAALRLHDRVRLGMG